MILLCVFVLFINISLVIVNITNVVRSFQNKSFLGIFASAAMISFSLILCGFCLMRIF